MNDEWNQRKKKISVRAVSLSAAMLMNGEIIIFIEMRLGKRGAKWRYCIVFSLLGVVGEEGVSESEFVCGGCVLSRVCNSGEKAKGDDERKLKTHTEKEREREYDGQR